MKIKKYLIIFVALLLVCIGCLAKANSIQKDGGNVEVTMGNFKTDEGNITYKLYKPVTATETDKAPAALLLHGYQNDHETCAAYSIELARRGYVVLAIDEYGHGSTDTGLLSRGYVNHKVTVNYGEDSKEDGTYVEISDSGAERYRIMMNFSNLSFFNDEYSKDSDGNSIKDSSCGGIEAYAYLSTLPYVDNTRMVVSGHSMGTWSSWSVAAAYSGTAIEPVATVLQCGELFTSDAYDSDKIHFNNVLLLQAKYDEFSYFRDYQNIVSDELLNSALRKEFLGTDNAAWNTTFGNFKDGTARRMELLYTNHRLTTHNEKGLSTALEWFDAASGHTSDFAYDNQVANTKELLTLVAMFAAIGMMLPLMEMLLKTKFFSGIVTKMPPEEKIKSKGKWWKGALISIGLAGASFPFMTQLGHGLLPLPEGIFRMTVGNGFVSWYSLLILIMVILTVIAVKSKKNPTNLFEMGLSTEEKPNRIDFRLVGKSLVMAFTMVFSMYVMVLIAEKCFNLDLRYIWPMFKSFNSIRIGQFAVYIVIFMLFYILNNSKIMAGLRTKAAYEKGCASFFKQFAVNAFVMVGGVLLVTFIEYIPFFAEIGPGADLLFGSTFGGPFMSLLILFLPQVIVFAFIGTYVYRRTNNVYTGAMLIAIIACWIVTGGSAYL